MYFCYHVTWVGFQAVWPQIKCRFTQIPLFDHPDSPYLCLGRWRLFPEGRRVGFSVGKPFQRGINITLCLFALRSDRPRFPPSCSSCGWIAPSWRWIWSIRSINRDYCNPRGQKEGTGPLRVYASHTDKSVQEWGEHVRQERKSLRLSNKKRHFAPVRVLSTPSRARPATSHGPRSNRPAQTRSLRA